MICANYSADHYCRLHEEYPEELPIRLCVFRKKTGAFSAPVLSKKIA